MRILMEEYAPQIPRKAQHYLEVVRDNALRMGDLIDDLLTFSRLSRQPLQKQAIAPAHRNRSARLAALRGRPGVIETGLHQSALQRHQVHQPMRASQN